MLHLLIDYPHFDIMNMGFKQFFCLDKNMYSEYTVCMIRVGTFHTAVNAYSTSYPLPAF